MAFSLQFMVNFCVMNLSAELLTGCVSHKRAVGNINAELVTLKHQHELTSLCLSHASILAAIDSSICVTDLKPKCNFLYIRFVFIQI